MFELCHEIISVTIDHAVVLLTDKPESLDRTEDGRFVYEGLVSANLRQPSGQAWQEFTYEVIDSFFDPQFDGFSKVTEPNQVITFVDYLPDPYLLFSVNVEASGKWRPGN